MNIDVGILHRHVRRQANKAQPQMEAWLDKSLSEQLARSTAFVLLCLKTILDLTLDEAVETLCDGATTSGWMPSTSGTWSTASSR